MFLLVKFFAAKRRRGDFIGRPKIELTHCKDLQTLVMAGLQARSAVFAHNVPAIHVFCSQQSERGCPRQAGHDG